MDSSRGMANERVGLAMIASSLTVIVVITALLLMSQIESRREQARADGVSLVDLLSKIPFDQLVPGDGHDGPLQVIDHLQTNSDFAYAVIVNVRGEPLKEVSAPGVIVPRAAIVRQPIVGALVCCSHLPTHAQARWLNP